MLRILRKKYFLRQKDVCDYLEISKTYLSMVENRHISNLSDELTLKFCELYKITLDDFLVLLENKI